MNFQLLTCCFTTLKQSVTSACVISVKFSWRNQSWVYYAITKCLGLVAKKAAEIWKKHALVGSCYIWLQQIPKGSFWGISLEPLVNGHFRVRVGFDFDPYQCKTFRLFSNLWWNWRHTIHDSLQIKLYFFLPSTDNECW